MLQIGDKAPLTVSIGDAEGAIHSLGDFLGQYIVLYFYPKDDTPGCTTEACEFRDYTKEMEKRGAVVIGVSKDTIRSHQKFTEKYHLSFPLWSDPDHALMDAFGVWGKRTFMGKSYMGTSRSTFLIDKNGTVVAVWEKVKPEGHAKIVLDTLDKVIDKSK